MPDQQAADLDQVKPFGQFLHEQRNGALHDDPSRGLVELVNACVETGKKGMLTLKVTISPNDDEETLVVLDDIVLKVPKPTTKAGLFYFDKDGNLLRRNPRQEELPLREVAGGKADEPRDLREAGAS